jgi:hypothetical protein
MEPAPPSPPDYHVAYSELVQNELIQLATRAGAAGHGAAFLNAIQQIDYRLRRYPQFGEPRRDLHTEGETYYVGVVPPLVVEYIIDEPRRLVFVIAPIKALPRCGFA